jgi:hypothetical protein
MRPWARSSYMVSTAKPKKKTWKEWRQEFMMGRREKAIMEFRPSDGNGEAHVFTYQCVAFAGVSSVRWGFCVGGGREGGAPVVVRVLSVRML